MGCVRQPPSVVITTVVYSASAGTILRVTNPTHAYIPYMVPCLEGQNTPHYIVIITCPFCKVFFTDKGLLGKYI